MFSKLRSAYAWALFAAIMAPLLPVSWLYRRLHPHDPRGDRLRVLIARWSSLYARATPLYRFSIEGRDHLPGSGPFVLVANHESTLDNLCIQMLSTPVRFLAEHWIFDIPLSGPLCKRAEHIPVEVGNRESGHQALVTAEDALRAGSPVAIYPEGGLSPDEMKSFKPGAFVLAQRANVPIVPVRIVGAGRAWRPGTVVVEGTNEIRIVILPPVAPQEIAEQEPTEVAEAVRQRLLGVAPVP
jgi:1-acyl-sn-glycerol-3-phosphate acyltransferase